jgi:hypothetical protein
VELAEMLVDNGVRYHDTSEGILKFEVIATLKTDLDDLREYLTFRKHFRPLGRVVWPEMRRAFLLQFALTNPSCFPGEAREVMADIANRNRREALCFQGIQELDYIYYAYECYREHKISFVISDIIANRLKQLDMVAKELPGFAEEIWTRKRRQFFLKFLAA